MGVLPEQLGLVKIIVAVLPTIVAVVIVGALGGNNAPSTTPPPHTTPPVIIMLLSDLKINYHGWLTLVLGNARPTPGHTTLTPPAAPLPGVLPLPFWIPVPPAPTTTV